MKKLLLLVASAVGIAVVAKSRSDQLKAGAAKVTNDPRVQSALATASEKAAPVASTVKEKAGPYVATMTEKAGPVVSQVTEKAGPVVSQVTGRVSQATGAASTFAHDRLHHNGVPTTETPAETSPVEAPEVPPAGGHIADEADAGPAPEFTGFEPPVGGSSEATPGNHAEE